MGAAFVEGRFQTPPLHEVTHHRFGRLWLVGRKEGFGWSFPRRIAREDPPNRQRCRAEAIPPGSASTQLQGSWPFPIPVQRQALPRRVWVVEHVLEGGKPRTRRHEDAQWCADRAAEPAGGSPPRAETPPTSRPCWWLHPPPLS